jgi:hypothetical protein
VAIMAKPEVSVCIPAYGMNGYGAEYLDASLPCKIF